jgi:hypothetical protein
MRGDSSSNEKPAAHGASAAMLPQTKNLPRMGMCGDSSSNEKPAGYGACAAMLPQTKNLPRMGHARQGQAMVSPVQLVMRMLPICAAICWKTGVSCAAFLTS